MNRNDLDYLYVNVQCISMGCVKIQMNPVVDYHWQILDSHTFPEKCHFPVLESAHSLSSEISD